MSRGAVILVTARLKRLGHYENEIQFHLDRGFMPFIFGFIYAT